MPPITSAPAPIIRRPGASARKERAAQGRDHRHRQLHESRHRRPRSAAGPHTTAHTPAPRSQPRCAGKGEAPRARLVHRRPAGLDQHRHESGDRRPDEGRAGCPPSGSAEPRPIQGINPHPRRRGGHGSHGPKGAGGLARGPDQPRKPRQRQRPPPPSAAPAGVRPASARPRTSSPARRRTGSSAPNPASIAR